MLTKRIIPCLDVDKGRVVKGINFVNLRDAGDPVECAKAYDAAGADELVFLDITASHEGRDIMLQVVRDVAESIMIPFTVGGGISDLDDIRDLLKAGCDKVSINTAAIQDPDVTRDRRQLLGQGVVVPLELDPHGDEGAVVEDFDRRVRQRLALTHQLLDQVDPVTAIHGQNQGR